MRHRCLAPHLATSPLRQRPTAARAFCGRALRLPAQRLGARLNGRYRRKKTYLGIYRLEEKLHKEFEQLVGLGFLKRKE